MLEVLDVPTVAIQQLLELEYLLVRLVVGMERMEMVELQPPRGVAVELQTL